MARPMVNIIAVVAVLEIHAEMLADRAWNGIADGALFGNVSQLAVQSLAVAATVAYSAAGTWVILKVIVLVAGLRATSREEGIGLDVTQHGEEAYSRGEGAILVQPERRGVDR